MNHLALTIAEQSHTTFWLMLLSFCNLESATTPALSLCTGLCGNIREQVHSHIQYVLLQTCSQLLPWKQTLQHSELQIFFLPTGVGKCLILACFGSLRASAVGGNDL